MLTRRSVLAAAPALALAGRARAQSAAPVIKIGAIQDASGPYSYLGGAGSLTCARQAITEMAGQHGLNVELLHADHQNKPDLGVSIVREWLDNGVDALLEFNNSAVALAVNGMVRDRDRVMLGNNVGSASLSGVNCTPNETHWVFDTAMLARVMGNALSDEGLDTWFFIRANYVFGRALQDDTAAIVTSRGGKIVGDVAVPLGTTDFASALLSAQSSGAKVVALALAGADLTNCIKQAAEVGIGARGQQIGALILYEQDIRALGLPTAQGVLLASSYYWDATDRTRAFAKRIEPNNGGAPPNMGQSGAYSAVFHYLKAVAAMGPAAAKASGRAAVAQMKQIPVDDDVLSNASIRPDGRVVSDVYLLQVKTPAESTSGWDLLKVKATVGPDKAWRPMSEGGCPLVHS